MQIQIVLIIKIAVKISLGVFAVLQQLILAGKVSCTYIRAVLSTKLG